ncbi:MAG: ribosome maturation factor RimM [Chitinophagales bacterium]
MNYLAVGKIKKPHGLSGAFHFSLYRMLKNPAKTPPHLFLEKDGIFQPLFIESWTTTGLNDAILKVEDINSPELARKLNNQELFLTEADAKKWLAKEEDDLVWLIGYQAMDGTELLGPITDLMTLPAQILATINYQGRELLVPLTDDLITDINKRKKQIIFTLPEGMRDL